MNASGGGRVEPRMEAELDLRIAMAPKIKSTADGDGDGDAIAGGLCGGRTCRAGVAESRAEEGVADNVVLVALAFHGARDSLWLKMVSDGFCLGAGRPAKRAA